MRTNADCLPRRARLSHPLWLGLRTFIAQGPTWRQRRSAGGAEPVPPDDDGRNRDGTATGGTSTGGTPQGQARRRAGSSTGGSAGSGATSGAGGTSCSAGKRDGRRAGGRQRRQRRGCGCAPRVGSCAVFPHDDTGIATFPRPLPTHWTERIHALVGDVDSIPTTALTARRFTAFRSTSSRKPSERARHLRLVRRRKRPRPLPVPGTEQTPSKANARWRATATATSSSFRRAAACSSKATPANTRRRLALR